MDSGDENTHRTGKGKLSDSGLNSRRRHYRSSIELILNAGSA
ncbi:hypothetical protein SV7mr_52230 [Stieleria bergensis]|uniref:Uncharacterized protein n=1 Tax=Stieleria bergensis TaxID=2528025 RepID=A0A517T2R8_9BACT|nr:hypothetical protein SV7mr_52230 [Planctomycetes bacterium SV_7m_r]